MTNEEKQLLYRDLCGRLPYGVKFTLSGGNVYTMKGIDLIVTDEGDWEYAVTAKGIITPIEIEYIKHYLRPLSSMTEEEKRELQSFFPGSFGSQWLDIEKETIEIFECPSTMTLYLNDSKRVIDFFNSRHIDYLGFIEDGLALEAPEGMYN